jgi:hypothetical protein
MDYLDVLQFVLPQLEDLQPDVVFQQDGSPPRWARISLEFLGIHLPGPWVERDGPIPWPPRSSDITPLDFFMCGYVKDIVYKILMSSLDEPKLRIFCWDRKSYTANVGHLEGN